MKISDYICFKPPTVYDAIVTIGVIIACLILWNIKISQTQVRIVQAEMQKTQITKEYLFEFYVTRNHILYIEAQRNLAFDAVRHGADPKVEADIFVKRVDQLFKLRDRGE